ncbi:MAG: bifunctional nuclease family protein [Firmicutes bacterium]|nr:bifunctional nuclease family protein [Bacillota bacterium]
MEGDMVLEKVEMKVVSIGLDPRTSQPVLILRDGTRNRLLPIWIGALEANAIALEMEGIKPPRPMTHDLLRNLLDLIGARVQGVLISDIKEETFYAMITLATSRDTLEIDSRPSDAIALALRTKAPIYAAEKVLETSAIPGTDEFTVH